MVTVGLLLAVTIPPPLSPAEFPLKTQSCYVFVAAEEDEYATESVSSWLSAPIDSVDELRSLNNVALARVDELVLGDASFRLILRGQQLGYFDCNGDGIPDECVQGVNDANSNGVPDRCECIGDFDSNGVVDIFDFGIFAASFEVVEEDARVWDGDADGNGTVDVFDFGLLAANFGNVCRVSPGSTRLPRTESPSQVAVQSLAVEPPRKGPPS